MMDELVSRLSALDRSKTAAEKFRDFCEMSFCALAKLTACPEEAEKLEDRYMQIVGTYQHKDAVRAYPQLLSLVIDGICAGRDVLGEAAGELGALDSGLGQFLTPYHVSEMMAYMALFDAPAVVQENGFITLSEPCVGSGGMVLATADVLHRMDLDPELDMLVHAIDLSQLCYHMAYVQISLKGVPAYVEWGNALTQQRFGGAWTLGALRFHAHHGRLFPEDRQPPAGKPEPPTAPAGIEQLSLF